MVIMCKGHLENLGQDVSQSNNTHSFSYMMGVRLKQTIGSWRMAQWLEVLASKHVNLSLNTHGGRRETFLLIVL